MLFGCGNSSELNLQVEAERSYHQTVLATLEKLFDEVCNYTSCFVFILRQIMYCSSWVSNTFIRSWYYSHYFLHISFQYNKDYDWNTFSTCLLLELDDYGEETKRVFISANNYGERCLCSYHIQGCKFKWIWRSWTCKSKWFILYCKSKVFDRLDHPLITAYGLLTVLLKLIDIGNSQFL